MPNKPKRLCTQPGCRGLYDPAINACSVCGPRAKTGWDRDGDRGTRQQRGYDNPWLKLRASKVAADPLCEECEKQGYTTVATEVHHIVPFNGLDDPLRLDWKNLESLCGACHGEKTRARR